MITETLIACVTIYFVVEAVLSHFSKPAIQITIGEIEIACKTSADLPAACDVALRMEGRRNAT